MSGKQPDHPEKLIAERVVEACDVLLDRVGTCEGCPDFLGDGHRCRHAPPDGEEVEVDDADE